MSRDGHGGVTSCKFLSRNATSVSRHVPTTVTLFSLSKKIQILTRTFTRKANLHSKLKRAETTKLELELIVQQLKSNLDMVEKKNIGLVSENEELKQGNYSSFFFKSLIK